MQRVPVNIMGYHSQLQSAAWMLWTKYLCPSQHSYFEAVTPNVMVFGSGALWGLLSLDEVMSTGPPMCK